MQRFVESVNKFTFAALAGILVFLFVLEICLLILRAQGKYVGTISMVARDRTWYFVMFAFMWGGLASHWWYPASNWGTTFGSILFWVVALLLLIWDIYLFGKPVVEWPLWMRFARFPFAWCITGFIMGGLLFPQKGKWPWEWSG